MSANLWSKSLRFDVNDADSKLIGKVIEQCKKEDVKQQKECKDKEEAHTSILNELESLEQCTIELDTKVEEMALRGVHYDASAQLLQ